MKNLIELNATIWVLFVLTSSSISGQGHALRFDGGDLVTFGRVSALSQFTVEAWVKPEPFGGSGNRVVVGHFAGPGETCSFGFDLSIAPEGTPWFGMNPRGCGFDGKGVSGPTTIVGQWTHLAGTSDGDTMQFYVNGEEVGAAGQVPFDASTWMTAGAVTFFNGQQAFYVGEMDEIRVWETVRTAQQIRETMRQPLFGTEPGLVGYWNFDEGSGQQVHDLSPSDVTGVLGTNENTQSNDPEWVTSEVPFLVEPEPNLLVYPQLALGSGFDVILFVTNQTDQDWRGEAQLDGGNWPADQSWTLDGTARTGESSFEIRLAAQETRKFILSSKGSARSGWLEIRGMLDSTTAQIATAFFYNYVSAGTLSASAGVSPAQGGTRFRFPVEKTANLNTGMAIRLSEGSIDFSLYDQEGRLVDTVTMTYSGARYVDQIFDEFFSQSPYGEFVGSVQVEGVMPFYPVVLRQEFVPGAQLRFQLTSIPATAVP